MQIATVFLWVAIFAVFLIVLSHMMPFFRGKAYFTARESTLRIILVSFLTFAPFLLAIVFLSPLLKIGIQPFVERIAEVWPADKAMAVFAPAMIFLLIVGGISIPLAAIFHYLFGFELFLKVNKRYELPPRAIEENPTICELLNIFSHCLETAGEKSMVRVFLLEPASRALPVSGCGIIGKDQSIALLLSKDFVKAFQEVQLTKEEIKAIFFHEIAHIKNRDYFMPLWSKMFIQSRLFFVAWGSFILGMIASSAAFVKMEGLSAVLNWSLLSKVIILTFGFILLKGVIYTLLSENLRGREYLADRSAIRYTSRDAITGAIKKSALLFAETGKFSWLSFTILDRKASWHPDPAKRIKALDESRIGFSGKIQPLKDVIFGTLLVAVFLFGVPLALEFLMQKWGVAEFINIYGPLNLFLTLFYFLAIGGLVAEHLLMQKYSTSWAWPQVHIRNFLIILILSVSGNLAARLPTQIRFLYRFRLHFFKTFLTSFVMATLFSIFFVVSFQKRKPPKGEEVPVEGTIE